MYKTISSLVSLFAILVTISSCACSYCEKMKYRDTQTTIESDIQKQAQKLAELSEIQHDDILTSLHAVLSENPRIFGTAYASAPYDEKREFINLWYAYRKDKKIKIIENNSYNFLNNENNSWYRKTYLNKKPMWSIPYYYTADSGEEYYITTYSYPVLEKGEVQFILTADYLLSPK